MSKAGYIKDEHYNFLLEIFPGNIIHTRSKALWDDMIKVLEKTGFESKLRIDEESFHIFIIDYFTDVARIKDFHSID
jgi:hypothetical protein